MNLVYCVHGGAITGVHDWLPTEPFDYAWKTTFGCNHLSCGRCGQVVTTELIDGGHARRYRCKCQTRDESGFLVLGADKGLIHEFQTEWHCAGHPQLQLPTTLDGVAIPEVGDFGGIVAPALTKPPFKPPMIRDLSFWVQRLYNLVPSAGQRDAIGRAVAAQLRGPDVMTERSAIEFFWRECAAAGAEEVAALALADRDRLERTPDPKMPKRSLFSAVLSALADRIEIRRADGTTVDATAVEVARAALLRGAGLSSMLFTLADVDRPWFLDHAVDVVCAKPDTLEFVLGALLKVPRDQRGATVAQLSQLDPSYPGIIQAWLARLPEVDRAQW